IRLAISVSSHQYHRGWTHSSDPRKTVDNKAPKTAPACDQASSQPPSPLQLYTLVMTLPLWLLSVESPDPNHTHCDPHRSRNTLLQRLCHCQHRRNQSALLNCQLQGV